MKGVILMAYGTPRSLGEVEAYYTHIRGGRKPSPADLSNLVDRYKAIGGVSPLIEITQSQRLKLQQRLEKEGSSTHVYSAMKHSQPFIEDVVHEAAKDGVTELLAMVLAPHYSKMSIGTYMTTLEMANANLPEKMKLDFVLSWHDHPKLIRAWASRIRDATMGLADDHYSLIFTAHSLPERIVAQGDPYRNELLETSELVAKEVGRKVWTFAFQSASHTGEPWLGPDVLEHLH